ALDSCFDAFSSREPVSTSLENALDPVLAPPGFESPWRQRFHPPLLPMIRRPVAETRGFLGRFREVDHARHGPAPQLLRRLADHIDEFRLVSHGRSLAKLSQGTIVRPAP